MQPDQSGATPADVDTSAIGDDDLEAQELLADAVDSDDPDGADALGDPGKKALDAMKQREKAARAESRELKKRLADLEAAAAAKDKTPDEQAIDAARREAAAETLAKANARILRSEVKAAAAGKLADPSDALRLLDLDQFEVGDDGEVDAGDIADAISELIKNKPYLAAQGGTTTFDSARGKRTPAGQLTRDDIKKMSPAEINAARKAGRLDNLLGKKP
ncbi:phage scaffolding protein [Micromonospora deserti]|uniref:Phage capsid protein n=1 Tax=Micromonospora deserti TaxID=2070366 RepID=A0A2W2CI51_9ACTN|nr:hypothetical protein [Micromonospora deserti]PZF98252.1 hypothetical protein C1I99_13785 [Micromonospora deserti]